MKRNILVARRRAAHHGSWNLTLTALVVTVMLAPLTAASVPAQGKEAPHTEIGPPSGEVRSTDLCSAHLAAQIHASPKFLREQPLAEARLLVWCDRLARDPASPPDEASERTAPHTPAQSK